MLLRFKYILVDDFSAISVAFCYPTLLLSERQGRTHLHVLLFRFTRWIFLSDAEAFIATPGPETDP